METVACELCGSDRSHVILRQGDLTHSVSRDLFTVVRCEDCRICYLNPRPTAAEIGRYYPGEYFAPLPPRSRTDAERALKRFSGRIKRWIMEDFYGYPTSKKMGLGRWLRKLVLWPEKVRRLLRGRDILPWIGAGRVLDVGCGPGGNLATLQEQGWEVYGVEMSPAAVAQARVRVGDRIYAGTLETAPFADGFFDVVLFSHSLEHLFSPVDALTRARRLLRPEGLLVIAVPNAGSLEAKLFGPCWFPWQLPRHLYHFEQETLKRLLKRAGFRVVRFRTGVGTLFFMASLDQVWEQRFNRQPPMRKAIEKLLARPLCLAAGHLGHGTEMTVYAVKS